ncbi:MAG TPA: alkaline phosphatase family protein, partial [Candidatus Hypogeohydataceae bacterium YC40]
PPRPLEGVLVCGFPTHPASEYTYPATIRREIESMGYVGGAVKAKSQGQSVDLYKLAAKTVEVFSHLIKKHDWTMAFLVVKETDSINHMTGSKLEAKKLYRYVDEQLRNVLPKGCTYVIVSDHGSTWCNYAFFLNDWLKAAGFLDYNLAIAPSYDLTQDWMEKVYAPRSMLTSILEKLSISRHLTLKILRKARLEGLKQFVPNWLKASVPPSNVVPNWKMTKAYPFSISSSAINVNLEGREKFGSVKKEEYELVKEDLVHKLSAVINPFDKKRCFREVLRREEIFKGDNLHHASDIIYIEEEGLLVLVNRVSPNGAVVTEHKASRHTMEGIFIASGPGIKKGVAVSDLSIVDVSPIILHMRAKKVPDYMDGEVRKDIFEEGSEFFQREICYEKSSGSLVLDTFKYSDEEKGAIEESLRSLGYL